MTNSIKQQVSTLSGPMNVICNKWQYQK